MADAISNLVNAGFSFVEVKEGQPMATPSQTNQDKADRLITEGKVAYSESLTDGHLFKITGDTGVYMVAIPDSGDPFCPCRARGRCSHLIAAQQYRATLDVDSEPEERIIEDQGVIIDETSVPDAEIAVVVDTSSAGVEIVEGDPRSVDLSHGSQPITYKSLELIAGTDAIPKDLRGNAPAIFAAVLSGQAWGLHPLESLRLIDVIEGRISPSAELYSRLYRQAGHRFDVIESTGEKCVVEGTRGDDGSTMRIEFSIDDAVKAGIAGKNNWRKYPADMLYNRCVVRLVRRLAADCMQGVSWEGAR